MNAPTHGFEPYHRFDFFELEDKTALVCFDVAELQRLVVDQLDALNYKVHTGMFLDDSLLKLRTHAYDVVVTSEFFAECSLENHAILKEGTLLPSSQRRRQLFALVGANLATNDEMQAFAHNADVVVSLNDIVNLKPILRSTVSRAEEFHAPLKEALAAVASGK